MHHGLSRARTRNGNGQWADVRRGWVFSGQRSDAQTKHFARLLTVMEVVVLASFPAMSLATMMMLIEGEVLSGTVR